VPSIIPPLLIYLFDFRFRWIGGSTARCSRIVSRKLFNRYERNRYNVETLTRASTTTFLEFSSGTHFFLRKGKLLYPVYLVRRWVIAALVQSGSHDNNNNRTLILRIGGLGQRDYCLIFTFEWPIQGPTCPYMESCVSQLFQTNRRFKTKRIHNTFPRVYSAGLTIATFPRNVKSFMLIRLLRYADYLGLKDAGTTRINANDARDAGISAIRKCRMP